LKGLEEQTMRAILLIEEDTLIRELMREHLEREGYATCAVATVRIALDASRWTRFGLVLLDFNSANACSPQQLFDLRALGAPVVMMRSAPAGTVIASDGAIEQVVWSPFDLSTLSSAVHRFLPMERAPSGVNAPEEEGPPVKQSGTYAATRPGETRRERPIAEITTLPAPPEDPRLAQDTSLEVLGQIVMEATNGRKIP
jgi:DNA-binding NtrC family response regulator